LRKKRKETEGKTKTKGMMMEKKKPICYVIAGPNGSGKTTFALKYLPEIVGCSNFVNADLIAYGISPLDSIAVQ
jgi:pantothenate kinase-related protein Tda10